MRGEASPDVTEVRAAKVVASLSLATDLAMGLPLQPGLQSTLAAMRPAEDLGVVRETATQTYYACLVFYVGCTADADVVAGTFPDDALRERLVAEARECVLRFDWADTARRIAAIYDSVRCARVV